MADVATKRVLENERIAVWEMVLEPGEDTGLHTHQHSYMLYVIEGSEIENFDTDGNSLGVVKSEPGVAVYFQLVAGLLFFDDNRFPATHRAKNIGDSRYREVLVEIK